MKYKLSIIIILLCTFAMTATAGNKKFALSTNALEWANFGTINFDAGMGISRHISLQLEARYNPWNFSGKTELPVYNHQMTVAAGMRWWPWYIFSGWWIGAKARYSDIGRTGIWRPALEKKSAAGAGLSFGYTFMVHKNFNIELGAGFWGGAYFKYNLYDCPKCMELRTSGARPFIDVDMVSVTFMYVF